MKLIVGTILMYGGAITVIVCSILAYFKALNDEDMEKEDMAFGMYVFQYPVYTVLIIAGAVLALFGSVWRY